MPCSACYITSLFTQVFNVFYGKYMYYTHQIEINICLRLVFFLHTKLYAKN